MPGLIVAVRIPAQAFRAILGQAGGARARQPRERVGNGRGPGRWRGAESCVAAFRDLAHDLNARSRDRRVAAGRNGRRRARVDSDESRDLDYRVARQGKGAAGRRIEDDDRLTCSHFRGCLGGEAVAAGERQGDGVGTRHHISVRAGHKSRCRAVRGGDCAR